MSAVAQAVASGDNAALTAALRADLSTNAGNIPPPLKERKGWVAWKVGNVDADRHKFGKVPIYPVSRRRRHGQQGSADDRAALGTWDEAFAAFNADPDIAGVGFATLPEFGVVALDADKCVTQESGAAVIADTVTAICGTTYAETSPSGSGVRAFWFGSAVDGKNHAEGFELFHAKGFVTVTGNHISGHQCETLSAPVAARLQALVASLPHTAPQEARCGPLTELEEAMRQVAASGVVLADVRDALSVIPADDRDLWVRMGHALKTLGDSALTIWHDWSATSDKYNPDDAERIWHSFQPTQTGPAAIFAEAARHGWTWRAETVAPPIASPHPVAVDLRSLPLVPPPVPFVIPGWLPAGVVTLFAAHGGAGKSFIALCIAICLATGRHPFEAGVRIPRRRVLFYSAEDGLPVLQGRLRRYLDYMAVSADNLDGWFSLLDATASDNVLFRADRGSGATTARYDWLAGEVRAFGAEVLIFDNASDAMDANENDRAAVRQFMSALRNVAPTVLLLSHVDAASSMGRPRDAKGYSGSTAWNNSARSRWFLTKDAGGSLVLQQPKVNYARAGAEVLLQWDDTHGVFTVSGSYAQSPGGDVYRGVLLRLVAQALDEGATISPRPTANNNAYRSIKDREGFPRRLDSAAVQQEVAAWQRAGLARVADYRKPNRTLGTCLLLTDAGRAVAAGGTDELAPPATATETRAFEMQF